jgi:hypothetical protein
MHIQNIPRNTTRCKRKTGSDRQPGMPTTVSGVRNEEIPMRVGRDRIPFSEEITEGWAMNTGCLRHQTIILGRKSIGIRKDIATG